MSAQRTKDKQRRKKNSVREMPEEDPDFQIAPMIDVLLVLLVFFMSISSTEVLQSTKGIELPVAAQGNDAAKNKHQVIVNVSWAIGTESGGITVDEKSYRSPAELTPFLQQRLQGDPVPAGVDPGGQGHPLRIHARGDVRRRANGGQQRHVLRGGQRQAQSRVRRAVAE